MKYLYYLSPNLVIGKTSYDDLHAAGHLDWYLNVCSKDKTGLAQKHIHSKVLISKHSTYSAGRLRLALWASSYIPLRQRLQFILTILAQVFRRRTTSYLKSNDQRMNLS